MGQIFHHLKENEKQKIKKKILRKFKTLFRIKDYEKKVALKVECVKIIKK